MMSQSNLWFSKIISICFDVNFKPENSIHGFTSSWFNAGPSLCSLLIFALVSGTTSVSMFPSSSLVSRLIKGSNRNHFDDVFPTLSAIRGRLRAERGVLETGSVCMTDISILLLIDESGVALIIMIIVFFKVVVTVSWFLSFCFFCSAFFDGYGATVLNCKLFFPSSKPMDNFTAITVYASKFPKPHIYRTLSDAVLRHV